MALLLSSGLPSWCRAVRTGARSLEADAVLEALPWVREHTCKEAAPVAPPQPGGAGLF